MDDGTPEASDYDNNFISYDQTVPGSYKRAMEEANRRRQPVTLKGSSLPCGAALSNDWGLAHPPLRLAATPAVTGTMSDFRHTLQRLLERTRRTFPSRKPGPRGTDLNTFLTFDS